MSIAITQDGRFLAVGEKERPSSIDLWDLKENRRTSRFGGSLNSPMVMHFAPKGDLLYALGDVAFGVNCYDVAAGNVRSTMSNKTDAQFPFGQIHWMTISADGTTGAMTNDDGNVHIWNTAKNELRSTISLNKVWSVALSRKGDLVATSVQNIGEVRLWNAATRKTKHVLNTNGINTALAFSPDDTILAAASTEGVFLWDTASGKRIRTLPFKAKSDAGCVAFSPNGQALAASDIDSGFSTGSRLSIWDLRGLIK